MPFWPTKRPATCCTKRGLKLRDLPRLSGDDVKAEVAAPHLAPSLFGEAALVIDLAGVKVPAGFMELLAKSGATVAILDASRPRRPASSSTRRRASTTHRPLPAKPGEVAAWVAKRAQSMQLKLDKSAAQYLAEVFGADLAGMVSELNKLTLLTVPN